MRTNGLSLIFFIFINTVFSQNYKKIDSVRNIMIKNAKNDTTRIDGFVALSELIYASNPDSAMMYVNKGLDLISKNEKNNNTKNLMKLKAMCFVNKGYFILIKGDANAAEKLYLDALKICKEIGFDEGIGDCFNNLGEAYLKLGKTKMAETNYEEGYKFYLKAKNETKVMTALNNLGIMAFNSGDTKKAIEYFKRSVAVLEKAGKFQELAVIYDNMTYALNSTGQIQEAIEYSEKAVKLHEKVKNFRGMAVSHNNIGSIYEDLGNFIKALEHYNKSKTISEKYNYSEYIAVALNNIGDIFSTQKDFDKALKYYQDGLKISIKTDNQSQIGNFYLNIGGVYKAKDDLKTSLNYYEKSIEIFTKLDDKSGISSSLNNLGSVYSKMNLIEKALEHYKKALSIAKETDNKSKQSIYYNNIGSIYFNQGDLTKADLFAKQGFEIAQKIFRPKLISASSELLSEINEKKGNTKEALKMYKLHIQMRDSTRNSETQKSTFKKQVQFDFEKRAATDSIKNAAAQQSKDLELKANAITLKQEKTQRFALYGGLALVGLFSVFMFNRFKVSQRQKNIISIQKEEVEHQKELIHEKQKEIIDSITYAKRLQQAILPPNSFINEYFPVNFVLYEPKDIVAGDFYWMHTADHMAFIAAADSTGHGVPGAMVSIVCSNALDKSVKEFGLTETGKILDKTTDLVLETFAKSGEEIKDGMDISLLCIDKQNKKISWSGANNQLWYINNNNELTEIKADKQPIGKSDHRKSFTTSEIPYQEGLIFYLMTDGYPDQFGGPKGKKFKYKQLEELLISISPKDLKEQKEILSTAFANWKGDLEQVDDVTIIGIKV